MTENLRFPEPGDDEIGTVHFDGIGLAVCDIDTVKGVLDNSIEKFAT